MQIRPRLTALALMSAAIAAASPFNAGCERSERGRGTPTATVPAAREPGPLRIVVSVPPLRGIIGSFVPPESQITVLLPPGASEHGHEITPGQIEAMVRADLVVTVGLGLEPRVESILQKQPSARRIDVSLATILGIADAGHEHDHEHGHDHDHGHEHAAVDPHLWLDPLLVKDAVPALRDAVIGALAHAGLTEHGEGHARAAADSYIVLCEEIDRMYRERLAPFAGRAIVTHHNAWSRIADRYGLTVAAVLQPLEGAEPTPAQVSACVDAIREKNARVIFIEPQLSGAAARRVADAAGAGVETLDPIGDGDWWGLMESNLDALVRGLSK